MTPPILRGFGPFGSSLYTSPSGSVRAHATNDGRKRGIVRAGCAFARKRSARRGWFSLPAADAAQKICAGLARVGN